MLHESNAQTQLRMATASALDQHPRDPRFYSPEREAKWKNASPLWSRFIPEYGLTNDVTCVGQSEEHIRRPTLGQHPSRTHSGPRTTPLISYNSIGWNRRHYEPIPDTSRPSTCQPYDPVMRRMASSGERSVRKPFGPTIASPLDSMALSESAVGSLMRTSTSSGYPEGSIGPFDPPRIFGVDTVSRPPLVVHSPSKVYRSARIGTAY